MSSQTHLLHEADNLNTLSNESNVAYLTLFKLSRTYYHFKICHGEIHGLHTIEFATRQV